MSDTVGWVPDPDGRGTFGLLSSCILTLGVCVWSAMHLNVPSHGESTWQYWMRNVWWCLTGVFGPELVVFIAWKQYLSAKTLVHKPEVAAFEESKGLYERPGMEKGVALLAECDLLPNIPREDIVDKSKSDGLAKLLACTQAVWMAIQIIGRLAAGLQVTLLEINTLGHILCALIIYVLWWHKPRLIQEPTTLEGDWVWLIAAYMYMSSRISREALGESAALETVLKVYPFLRRILDIWKRTMNRAQFEVNLIASPHSRGGDFPSLKGIEGSFGFCPAQHDGAESQHEDIEYKSLSDNADNLKNRRALRWQLASEAFCRYPAIRRRFESVDNADTEKGIHCLREKHPKELVSEYSGNWSTDGLLHGIASVVMGMVLWCASMAFGAVHAAAWHDYFPSVAEAWIWRASSIYIVFSGFLWSIINLCARLSRAFDDYWVSMRRSSPPYVGSLLLSVVMAGCGAAYAFARAFLVIEAFISLRQLPQAAYLTPQWTQVIPHL